VREVERPCLRRLILGSTSEKGVIDRIDTLKFKKCLIKSTECLEKEQPAPIFIGALTPGIKQKATSVRLSNPSYGLLESGKVGRQKKMFGKRKL
jgi:hypothetical protein